MSQARGKVKLKKEMQQYDCYNSPFLELSTPFTAWEAVKMLVLIWLVPIRLAVGIWALLVLAASSFIVAYKQDISRPLKPWRRKLVIAASKCAGVVLLALGFRIRVVGFGHYAQARKAGAMGVFNHSSWVDSILLMWLFAPSGVSLASNANLPLIGTCIKAFQNIYVPRSSHGTAASTKPDTASTNGNAPTVSDLIADSTVLTGALKSAGKRARDRRFPMLVAAPEGTCSDGRCLLHFRSGCFLPGVPLLPIVLSYGKSAHNPAWTIINEGWHFVYNTVDVTILPPYIPSESEKRDARLFANNVRQLFADTLKLPLVEQTVQHYVALTRGNVRVSWDGRKVLAPEGVLNSEGMADISHNLLGPDS